MITNEDNRGSWDLFFKDGGVVKKTSETSGYVYYQTHPQGWTVWPRDFVIAIEGKEVDCSEYPDLKEIKFVGTSVTLEEKPVISSHVRGTIHLGGYHLKPIKEPNMIEGIEYYTHITYILTVDAGGWIPQRYLNFPFFFFINLFTLFVVLLIWLIFINHLILLA